MKKMIRTIKDFFLKLPLFVYSAFYIAQIPTVQVSESELKFKIPELGQVLTFIIRIFFAFAGLAAILYLILGALGWITSGGSKEGVEKARDKIEAAVIGIIIIVAVLAVLWTLEQIIFGGKLCFGISCPLSLPTLLKAP